MIWKNRDNRIYLLDTCRNQIPGLKSNPDLQPSPTIPQICRLSTLNCLPRPQSPNLPQNRNSTLKQIHIRIQLSPNPLQQKNTNDDIHKISLQSHMMIPHHRKNFMKHISEFNLSQCKSLTFHPQHEMLHFQSKDFWIQNRIWLTTSFNH